MLVKVLGAIDILSSAVLLMRTYDAFEYRWFFPLLPATYRLC